MPMPARPKKPMPELFRFAVENWSFDYGLSVNNKRHGILGLCWEHHDFSLVGRLRSETKRKIERVALRIRSKDFDPKDWREEWKFIGAVTGVRERTLDAFVDIPTASFQSLLAAVVAGKVRGADISIDNMARSSGWIRSFYTVDPDEPVDG